MSSACPPLHGTRGGAVERPAPSACAHGGARMQGQCQGAECQHQFRLGQGRPRNTDLRGSCIINCTSVLRSRASRQRRRVRIASTCYTAAHFCFKMASLLA